MVKLRRKVFLPIRARVRPRYRLKSKLKACQRHHAGGCHARAIAATGTTILPCSTVSIVLIGIARQVVVRHLCAGHWRLMAWRDV